MTKKDFELIARVFAGLREETRTLDRDEKYAYRAFIFANGESPMADALAGVSPRFNRARFLAACEGRTRRCKGEYVYPDGK